MPPGSVPTVALLLTWLPHSSEHRKQNAQVCSPHSSTSTPALRQADFEPHLRGFYPECGFRHAEAGLRRLTKLREGR